VDYKPGEATEIMLHDGSKLILKKLHNEYDPADRMNALNVLEKGFKEQKIITGLIYYKKDAKPHHELLNLVDVPLRDLTEKDLIPTKEEFDALMKELL